MMRRFASYLQPIQAGQADLAGLLPLSAQGRRDRLVPGARLRAGEVIGLQPPGVGKNVERQGRG